MNAGAGDASASAKGDPGPTPRALVRQLPSLTEDGAAEVANGAPERRGGQNGATTAAAAASGESQAETSGAVESLRTPSASSDGGRKSPSTGGRLWERARILVGTVLQEEEEEGRPKGETSPSHRRKHFLHNGLGSQALMRPTVRSALLKANKRFSFILSEVRRAKPTYTIDPGSTWKQAWDWMIILFVIYNATVIPLSLAFEDRVSHTAATALFVFDTIVDCLFFLDIVLSFRTEFPDNRGDPIKDGREIANAYIKSGWFWIDLLATIPFDQIISAFLADSGQHTVALALLKTIRLFRLGRLLKKLEQLAAANALRIVKLMFTYVMCVHWFACGWFWIAEEYRASTQEDEDGRWTHVYKVADADLSTQYGVSFHYALTCILPGASIIVPGTNIERTYSDLVMIAGALMNAFVFGNVAALIQDFDHNQAKYSAHLESITAFTTHFAVPLKLKTRMRAYFENMWTILGGFDVKEMTKSLPRRLQYDVFSHIYAPLVKNSKIFSDCDQAFVRLLISRLTPVFVVPNEVLVGVEDPVQEMFFIQRGVAAVIATDGTVKALLRQGDPVGHIALLQGEKRRTASVQAVEMLELARLDRKDFEECLDMYPDHRGILQRFARIETNRFKQMAKLQEDAERRGSEMSEIQEFHANGPRPSNADSILDDSPSGFFTPGRVSIAHETSNPAQTTHVTDTARNSPGTTRPLCDASYESLSLQLQAATELLQSIQNALAEKHARDTGAEGGKEEAGAGEEGEKRAGAGAAPAPVIEVVPASPTPPSGPAPAMAPRPRGLVMTADDAASNGNGGGGSGGGAGVGGARGTAEAEEAALVGGPLRPAPKNDEFAHALVGDPKPPPTDDET